MTILCTGDLSSLTLSAFNSTRVTREWCAWCVVEKNNQELAPHLNQHPSFLHGRRIGTKSTHFARRSASERRKRRIEPQMEQHLAEVSIALCCQKANLKEDGAKAPPQPVSRIRWMVFLEGGESSWNHRTRFKTLPQSCPACPACPACLP